MAQGSLPSLEEMEVDLRRELNGVFGNFEDFAECVAGPQSRQLFGVISTPGVMRGLTPYSSNRLPSNVTPPSASLCLQEMRNVPPLIPPLQVGRNEMENAGCASEASSSHSHMNDDYNENIRKPGKRKRHEEGEGTNKKEKKDQNKMLSDLFDDDNDDERGENERAMNNDNSPRQGIRRMIMNMQVEPLLPPMESKRWGKKKEDEGKKRRDEEEERERKRRKEREESERRRKDREEDEGRRKRKEEEEERRKREKREEEERRRKKEDEEKRKRDEIEEEKKRKEEEERRKKKEDEEKEEEERRIRKERKRKEKEERRRKEEEEEKRRREEEEKRRREEEERRKREEEERKREIEARKREEEERRKEEEERRKREEEEREIKEEEERRQKEEDEERLKKEKEARRERKREEEKRRLKEEEKEKRRKEEDERSRKEKTEKEKKGSLSLDNLSQSKLEALKEKERERRKKEKENGVSDSKDERPLTGSPWMSKKKDWKDEKDKKSRKESDRVVKREVSSARSSPLSSKNSSRVATPIPLSQPSTSTYQHVALSSSSFSFSFPLCPSSSCLASSTVSSGLVPVEHKGEWDGQAKDKKHKGDAATDRVHRYFNYMESCAFFAMSVSTIHPDRSNERDLVMAGSVLKETIELMKQAMIIFEKENNVHLLTRAKIVCLRAQSILYYHMYFIRSNKYSRRGESLASLESQVVQIPRASPRKEENGGKKNEKGEDKNSATPSSSHSSIPSSPSSNMVSMPMSLWKVKSSQTSTLGYLEMALRLWNESVKLVNNNEKHYFNALDNLILNSFEWGCPLNVGSSLVHLVNFIITSISWLRQEYEGEQRNR